jgi:hypothetical protein
MGPSWAFSSQAFSAQVGVAIASNRRNGIPAPPEEFRRRGTVLSARSPFSREVSNYSPVADTSISIAWERDVRAASLDAVRRA